MKPQGFVAAGMALACMLAAAACGSSSGSGGSGSGASGSAKQITVWSEENDPSRIAITKEQAAKFTAETGIKVKIVGLDENQFQQLVTEDAAAGKLPDVIGALPLDSVQYLASNDLLNTAAAKAVIDNLGPSTFDQSAIRLTQYKGAQAAVPSDAWVQLLIYRKDLFDKAHLPAPTTYARIQAAAQKLNSPGMAGITMATDPGDAFTEQTFEYFALANGCQMVNSGGQPTLTSKPCQDTFNWYTNLVRNDSVRGTQTVDTTRATYFAGKAAMVVWSSYLLGEMAGLVNEDLPTCPQCKSDHAFLAKNSGIVTAVQGPDGSAPAQFGEVTSWTITKTAQAAAAEKFIEFMLSKGYTSWLGMSPEGKFPVRHGTISNPTQYADAWARLDTGVDTRAPLSKFYAPSVLNILKVSPNSIHRWGLDVGQGALVGAASGQLVVPKAVAAAANGATTPAGAAQQAQQAIEQIKSSQ